MNAATLKKLEEVRRYLEEGAPTSKDWDRWGALRKDLEKIHEELTWSKQFVTDVSDYDTGGDNPMPGPKFNQAVKDWVAAAKTTIAAIEKLQDAGRRFSLYS